MSWFCKHDWKVLDKTVMESPYEQIVKSGSLVRDMRSFESKFFRKKVLVIVVCSKCGKKSEHVETNPCGRN